MKRILGTALALTLLTGTAASAHDWHGGYRGGHHGYHYGRGDGAAIGIGLGILALGIIAAENAHDRDYHDRAYAPPPPPPGGDRGDGYYDDRGPGAYDDERGPPPPDADRGDDDDGYDDAP